MQLIPVQGRSTHPLSLTTVTLHREEEFSVLPGFDLMANSGRNLSIFWWQLTTFDGYQSGESY